MHRLHGSMFTFAFHYHASSLGLKSPVVDCAHEYTEANARFAMSVEPGNPDLVKRVEEIKVKRARGEPTVPSLLGEEKATNPFLRGDVSSEIRKNVGASEGDDGATIFHKIRLGKDHFRG
jgi:hydroxyacylglutathione hydrolase